MNIRSRLSSLREYLTPVNNTSNFISTGEISPEEFVLAGDYLVQKFPTWSWGSSAKGLHKTFLPPDKQFLVTRHVPSYRRYGSFIPGDIGLGALLEALEDGLDSDTEVIASFSTAPAAANEVPEVDLDAELLEDDVDDDINDYANIQTDQLGLRKYDLYIGYSTSYRVPKMYLVGFNGNGIPLLPSQMYEDISGDHKDKTATIEPLPMAQNTTGVSIHPCKHSSVMRVLMEHAKARSLPNNSEGPESFSSGPTDTPGGGFGEKGVPKGEPTSQPTVRVDHYLVIFLKFMASVTPGIEYDFTMDAL